VKKKAFVLMISLLVLVTLISTVYAATPVKVSPSEGENTYAEIELLKSQVARLESALIQDNPQDAAEAWATAVKTRNGAWQYALMTPELRAENRQQLIENNWSTGTSSPWIDSFTVVEREKVDAETYIYDISYAYLDSTGATFSTPETVVIKESDGKWLIESVEPTPDICGEITEISKQGELIRIFVEDKNAVSTYDKAYVAITDETKIYEGRTDKIIAANQLKEGSLVEIVFSGPALMSYPVQVGAGTIRVY